MASQIERVVARIAPRQHGLVTRGQLRSEGIDGRVVSYQITAGRLVRLHPGVYRVAGAPCSWRQSVLAATLSAGGAAAASGPTAAILLGLSDLAAAPIEVTVPFTSHPKADGFVLHRSRRAFEPVTVDGIPTTPPVRTLEDLARVVPDRVLEELIDKALHRRLVSPDDLKTGRGGVSHLALERSGRPPESVLETRFLRILRDAGLPRPVGQVEIRRGGTLLARVDFAYPPQLIAIEIDGYRYHSGRLAFDKDRARRTEIRSAGYVLLEFTSTHHLARDMWSRPSGVCCGNEGIPMSCRFRATLLPGRDTPRT